MTGDVLSPRELGRATLARQLLLDRSEGEGERRVVSALGALAGLQGQAPDAPYVALWSRLRAFRPEELATELLARRAVRIPLMRGTVHLVTAADAARIRPLVQTVLERAFASQQFARNIAGVDRERLLSFAREITGERPLTRVELADVLVSRWPGVDATSLVYAVTFLMPAVQTPPRGIWGASGPPVWTPLEHWLAGIPPAREDSGAPAPSAAGEAEGTPVRARELDNLFLRFLSAFGPASIRDAQTWSGLTRLTEVAGRLRPVLRVFRDEEGCELFDLPDAPRPDAETPAPPRFLGEYDNILLSYADRRRVNPENRRVPLLPGNGAKKGTVLVDGAFAGTWALARPQAASRARHGADIADDHGAVVGVELFRAATSSQRQELEEEAMRLLTFLVPGAGNRTVQLTSSSGPPLHSGRGSGH